MGDLPLPDTTPRLLLPYEEFVARMYTTKRLPGTREVALALAWLVERDPARPRGADVWRRLVEICGPRRGNPRLGDRARDLVAADAPRYERLWRRTGACEGPRIRPYKQRRARRDPNACLFDHHPHIGDCQFTKVYVTEGYTPPPPNARDLGQECGAHATICVTEADMVTGWEIDHWFCRRHSGRAEEVRQQIAERGDAPPPVPNRGGRLPLWFDADWEQIYRWGCSDAGVQVWGNRNSPRGWEPPYHGLRCDQWPKPDGPIPKRPRLRVLADEPADEDGETA